MLLLLALLFAAPADAAPVRDAAWASSLKPGAITLLPAGLYRGPWRLPAGVHLRASPGAILEGGDPVLTIHGSGVTVEGLTVRASGQVGVSALEANGTTLLEVHISGGAIGLKARKGSLSWSGGGAERSSKYGLWLQGLKVTLSRLVLQHHAGPALYLGHAAATLRDLQISDSEYGLLTFESELELVHSQLRDLQRAGVALNLTSGELRDNDFDGPFGEAALAISSARAMVLRNNHLVHAGSIGIKVIHSTVTLANNQISGARSDNGGLEGDGLYSNNSQLESNNDRLSDNGGASVSIMGGKASLKGCRIEGSGQAAAAVSGRGELSLSGCTILDGSVELMVSPGSTLNNENLNPQGLNTNP